MLPSAKACLRSALFFVRFIELLKALRVLLRSVTAPYFCKVCCQGELISEHARNFEGNS